MKVETALYPQPLTIPSFVINTQDSPCATDMSCGRTYVSEYVHVGGYYGACNEETMLETLVTTGPISVSFMVYDDFHNYEGGIYHYTGSKNEFNPFEVNDFCFT